MLVKKPEPGGDNRKISDEPPPDYPPSLVEKAGEQAFEAQCMPMGRELLDLVRYKEFLKERRRLIADALNAFLGPRG
jgi:hypothetical protein